MSKDLSRFHVAELLPNSWLVWFHVFTIVIQILFWHCSIESIRVRYNSAAACQVLDIMHLESLYHATFFGSKTVHLTSVGNSVVLNRVLITFITGMGRDHYLLTLVKTGLGRWWVEQGSHLVLGDRTPSVYGQVTCMPSHSTYATSLCCWFYII